MEAAGLTGLATMRKLIHKLAGFVDGTLLVLAASAEVMASGGEGSVSEVAYVGVFLAILPFSGVLWVFDYGAHL